MNTTTSVNFNFPSSSPSQNNPTPPMLQQLGGQSHTTPPSIDPQVLAFFLRSLQEQAQQNSSNTLGVENGHYFQPFHPFVFSQPIPFVMPVPTQSPINRPATSSHHETAWVENMLGICMNNYPHLVFKAVEKFVNSRERTLSNLQATTQRNSMGSHNHNLPANPNSFTSSSSFQLSGPPTHTPRIPASNAVHLNNGSLSTHSSSLNPVESVPSIQPLPFHVRPSMETTSSKGRSLLSHVPLSANPMINSLISPLPTSITNQIGSSTLTRKDKTDRKIQRLARESRRTSSTKTFSSQSFKKVKLEGSTDAEKSTEGAKNNSSLPLPLPMPLPLPKKQQDP